MFTFRDLLDYSERLHNDAREAGNEIAAYPYIIGSILMAWMSIESFINNMLQDFSSLPEGIFTVHEQGFLEERQVRFISKGAEAGTFQVGGKDDYKRLEDKIQFLLAKCGRKNKLNKGATIWQDFEKIKTVRNALSHPKRTRDIKLTLNDAGEAIEVARDVISFVSRQVWKKQIKW